MTSPSKREQLFAEIIHDMTNALEHVITDGGIASEDEYVQWAYRRGEACRDLFEEVLDAEQIS